ncbi:HAD superfamily hydrolase (TIGR01450 family) [Ereboglobus sp. PH5-10]|uniref:HAD-IIA family hydrolase n=1 Tax=Ereboglobus sp. PH5-10 TaxID=2940629 RepID=UPI002404FCDA|nr:HAD-IIA family hydrolase [Ereboglobus sp. PH5-10]MDF9828309.1 HAD superfamily hydrolase (TIGR01450 family) [Ereboglobus sp. PH5-10]
MTASATTNADTSRIRHVVLDMDGTIYKGGTLFPWTKPFLDSLTRHGIGYTFLTNNPSKSSADYLAHLERIGIPSAPEQLYTSAQATIDWLKANHPEFRRLFLLGTPSMIGEFTKAGYESANDDPADIPDAVIAAFDMSLTYARLCRASWWASQGRPYFATNPDRICPTDLPTVLVDCAAICAAIQSATGRAPDKVFGKPDPSMVTGILQRHNLRPEEVAMVGDRIYTDIAMAQNAGVTGVLVLSGEATRQDAEESSVKADIIVENLAGLGEMLTGSR